MESISDIKKIFDDADMGTLSSVIEKYRADERLGVQKLIKSALKRFSDYENEKMRMNEMFHFERLYSEKKYIAGIDEVGRGPLAGPVVACALILPKNCDILYINDSKQLSAKKRDELYDELRNKAVSYGIGIVGHEKIDEVNILQATYIAMRDAISKLSVKPDQLLVDAVKIPEVDTDQRGIIKGDARSASIAAASIVAKVYRDRLMEEYDKKYPGYGFAENKGYGTKVHTDALKTVGPCEIHRRSFIGNFI